MGLFGGDNPNQEANDLANQQIQQNQAEIENKRQSLYKERLDIVKGQGNQSWSPEMGTASLGAPKKTSTPADRYQPLGGAGQR